MGAAFGSSKVKPRTGSSQALPLYFRKPPLGSNETPERLDSQSKERLNSVTRSLAADFARGQSID